MLDDGYVGLRVSTTEWGVDIDEPDDFVQEWTGHVTLDLDDDPVREIGTFAVFYVDVVGAITEGMPVFDVFDSRQSTVDYYADLYDTDSDFKPSVVKIACGDDYLWNPNLLILERLIIYPEYRGHARGLTALRGLMHRFRLGAGLIAMKPYPLQNESHYLDVGNLGERQQLKLDDFPSNHRTATVQLRRYYQKLGFRKMPKSDYMVLDPNRRIYKKK